MTSHALGELADSRRTLLQRAAGAGGRHGRHLERMASYQKFNRCVFTSKIILASFIAILRFLPRDAL